jgi:hypothetical protein
MAYHIDYIYTYIQANLPHLHPSSRTGYAPLEYNISEIDFELVYNQIQQGLEDICFPLNSSDQIILL